MQIAHPGATIRTMARNMVRNTVFLPSINRHLT